MTKGLVWIRRDLRLHDHTALSECLKHNTITYLVFIFDSKILDPLKKPNLKDSRVQFISDALLEIQTTLEKNKAGLIILNGDPTIEIPKLAQKLNVNSVYFNRDYSPYARHRDANVTAHLKKSNIKVNSYRDHVVFEPEEILNQQEAPYKVFTPYSKAWLQKLHQDPNRSIQKNNTISDIKNDSPLQALSLNEILSLSGFKKQLHFYLEELPKASNNYKHLNNTSTTTTTIVISQV